jgi:hypothetical protein
VEVVALEEMSTEIVVASDGMDLVSTYCRSYFLSECFYVNIDPGNITCLLM